MKFQETNFYEKYWRKKSGDAIFQDIPIWGNVEDLNKMTNFFKEGINGRILDAGCGEGDWVFHLAKFDQVVEVLGVDISKTAIKQCIKKRKAKKLHKKSKFITASLDELPFKNETIDNIFSIDVIEHVLDVDGVFAEFNRVLKKGGYVGITTVDFNFLKMIIIGAFFFEKYFDPRSPHVRFFTQKTLGALLDRNGFQVKNHSWQSSYLGLMPMAQMVLARKIRDL